MSYERDFAIKLFFNEIIKISHRSVMMAEAIAAGGYPLSGLINDLLISGGTCLMDEMTNDYTDESHEFRLNEAGLKLYWRLDVKHGVFKISIGGDQVNSYPQFVAAVRNVIRWNTYLR